MKTLNKYVGLDVHKDTTVIAVAGGNRTGEVRIYGTISSDLHALDGARMRGDGAALSKAKGELNGSPPWWAGKRTKGIAQDRR